MNLSKDYFITTRRLFLLFCFAFLFLPKVVAQIGQVEVNDRVKISAPELTSRTLKGNILSISSTDYELALKDTTLMVPFSGIETLAVSTGRRRNTGKGAVIGAVGLGFTMGMVSAISNEPCEEDDAWCLLDWSDTEAFGIGALLGGILGAGVGALVGYSIETDRWEKVPIQEVSVGFLPSSYPSLSVRFSIRK